MEQYFISVREQQEWPEELFFQGMALWFNDAGGVTLDAPEACRWLARLMHAAAITREKAEEITTQSRPNEKQPTQIRGLLLIDEVIVHLTKHGCEDISSRLDFDSAEDNPVAQGGYCDIFKMTIMPDQALVALKVRRVLTPEGANDLKDAARELHTWSKCEHPNVMKLLGFTKFRNRIAIVCPWMEYGHLRNYLSRRPEANRSQLSTQICEGLVYLHEHGIVHGDLKGDNVLVSNHGVPVLTDFGNATLKDRTLMFSGTTGNNAMTIRWAAPELLRGETGHTTKADVYGLGMTILVKFLLK
ncbi:kinase domain protein [Ceratobasidium sp. AG-Ba]|nr:kinase domain protein [Ceratobasidium sp. AG-Ba]QRW12418.1 kinase domain protein [Ceratobasidium sp. AG-Ba]